MTGAKRGAALWTRRAAVAGDCRKAGLALLVAGLVGGLLEGTVAVSASALAIVATMMVGLFLARYWDRKDAERRKREGGDG